jgi:hypothetical protein
MIKMYIGLHLSFPLFLSNFNETRYLLTYLKKNSQLSNFVKIGLVGWSHFISFVTAQVAERGPK